MIYSLTKFKPNELAGPSLMNRLCNAVFRMRSKSRRLQISLGEDGGIVFSVNENGGRANLLKNVRPFKSNEIAGPSLLNALFNAVFRMRSHSNRLTLAVGEDGGIVFDWDDAANGDVGTKQQPIEPLKKNELAGGELLSRLFTAVFHMHSLSDKLLISTAGDGAIVFDLLDSSPGGVDDSSILSSLVSSLPPSSLTPSSLPPSSLTPSSTPPPPPVCLCVSRFVQIYTLCDPIYNAEKQRYYYSCPYQTYQGQPWDSLRSYSYYYRLALYINYIDDNNNYHDYFYLTGYAFHSAGNPIPYLGLMFSRCSYPLRIFVYYCVDCSTYGAIPISQLPAPEFPPPSRLPSCEDSSLPPVSSVPSEPSYPSVPSVPSEPSFPSVPSEPSHSSVPSEPSAPPIPCSCFSSEERYYSGFIGECIGNWQDWHDLSFTLPTDCYYRIVFHYYCHSGDGDLDEHQETWQSGFGSAGMTIALNLPDLCSLLPDCNWVRGGMALYYRPCVDCSKSGAIPAESLLAEVSAAPTTPARSDQSTIDEEFE